jgi:hypothetical protein
VYRLNKVDPLYIYHTNIAADGENESHLFNIIQGNLNVVSED